MRRPLQPSMCTAWCFPTELLLVLLLGDSMLNMLTTIIGRHPSSLSKLQPKKSKKTHHLRFDFCFRLARPWYDKMGRVFLDESGVPLDMLDLTKLYKGFDAAFASIGSTELRFSRDPKEGRICENPKCRKTFTAKRSTARFCPDCREDAYALRMLDPKYAELNRERAKKGMKDLRDRRIGELIRKTAKLKRSGR